MAIAMRSAGTTSKTPGNAAVGYLAVNLVLIVPLVIIVFLARKAGGVMYAGPLGALTLTSIVSWLIVALLPMRDRAGPLSPIHYFWIAFTFVFFALIIAVDTGWFGPR